jgi:hypothetical protein
MNTAIRTFVIGATLTALPFFCHAQSATSVAAIATAAPASCAPAPASGLQQRIVAKAAEGVDALRWYLWITRAIYNVSMEDAVASIDRERAARADCVALRAAPARP